MKATVFKEKEFKEARIFEMENEKIYFKRRFSTMCLLIARVESFLLILAKYLF